MYSDPVQVNPMRMRFSMHYQIAMAYVNVSSHFLKCFVIFVITKSDNFFVVAQRNKTFFTSLRILCPSTAYPNTCYNTLDPLINPETVYDSRIFYNLSVYVAERELLTASRNFGENGTVAHYREERVQLALRSCRKLLHLALDYLHWPTPRSDLSRVETRESSRIRLTGVGSLLKTCKEEFDYTPYEVQKVVGHQLKNSIEVVANSLSIIFEIDHQMRISNKDDYGPDTENKHVISEWPPMWLSDDDKLLLHNSILPNRPGVVVAADGSGDYVTISAALDVVPPKSNKRFIIYVKAGVYNENVVVENDKWNILMYGDGMNKTVVSGSRNNASGSPTYDSATFAVLGRRFIAMYITFQNTAGLNGGQAVALLTAADKIIYYRCIMDGYQDTVYAHMMIQFYRECKIYGTVDVIFGYAAVVFQKCNIYAKRPIPGQPNVMIAQGKGNAWSYSGFSIQHCRFLPAEDLTCVQTFLGRPWFDYSTTVIMESYLGRLIDPKGWVAFTGVPVPPDTIYFAEYRNKGPRANTSKRANWPGVKRNISRAEASKFTVRSFIRGVEWLPGTRVPFQPDL